MKSLGFLSCVSTAKTEEDLISVGHLIDFLRLNGVSHEVVLCIPTGALAESILSDFVAKNDNVAVYQIRASDEDSLMSVGLEMALGDWILQLGNSSWRSAQLLLEEFKTEDADYFQILPKRKKFRDRMLSKIATAFLESSVATMYPTPRLMSRKSLYAWNHRKARNKVFRIAPCLEKSKCSIVVDPNFFTTTNKRFLRVSLRTIVSASAKPLRIVSFISWLGAFMSLATSLYIFVVNIFFSVVPGWTTTNLQISILSLLTLTVLGFIAEYVYQLLSVNVTQVDYTLGNEFISKNFEFKRSKNLMIPGDH